MKRVKLLLTLGTLAVVVALLLVTLSRWSADESALARENLQLSRRITELDDRLLRYESRFGQFSGARRSICVPRVIRQRPTRRH